ncbi:unnamed protein product [Vitrella brassicaformis CCMP3155]|uniref:DM13 domain-containing protein n=2 Tax=Vitrella brassicaformis TaxID=1169539 RepID=A0A0G4ECB7_VITBC|nr:unnamed protein product [Vitrella brassicaformis CCMP3155]|eukprot:CEL92984.1 unnamed protein product [Vitrella brassicaformis CCMP3155]
MMVRLSAVLLAVALFSAAPLSLAAKPVLEGSFVDADKSVSGTIQVLEEDDGSYSVKFMDYETSDGPDLFLYFSPQEGATGIGGGALMVELAPDVNAAGQALFEGEAMSKLPADFDPEQAKRALIWCREFAVLFGYADLKPVERRSLRG